MFIIHSCHSMRKENMKWLSVRHVLMRKEVVRGLERREKNGEREKKNRAEFTQANAQQL